MFKDTPEGQTQYEDLPSENTEEMRNSFIAKFHCEPEESKNSRLKAIGYAAGWQTSIITKQAELDVTKQSEREGWRYSGELELERKRLQAELDAAKAKITELKAVLSLNAESMMRVEVTIATLQAKIDKLEE